MANPSHDPSPGQKRGTSAEHSLQGIPDALWLLERLSCSVVGSGQKRGRREDLFLNVGYTLLPGRWFEDTEYSIHSGSPAVPSQVQRYDAVRLG